MNGCRDFFYLFWGKKSLEMLQKDGSNCNSRVRNLFQPVLVLYTGGLLALKNKEWG
jgi:hypothetical protein